jgi:uncharacterized FlaG/YvyC family protein
MEIGAVGSSVQQQQDAAPAATHGVDGAGSSSGGATESSQSDHHQALTSAVARLLSGSNGSHESSVRISYRVNKNPDEIVTVFTDTRTGQEIAQFPSEVMLQIAEFFDKQSGVTVDESV